MKIHPNTELIISTKAPISHTHLQVLALLYQPMIGPAAMGLYTALHALVDRSQLKSPKFPHAFFFDMMGLTPEQFLHTRQHLEAVGLIETYETKQGFLIELYLPLSAEAFIKDAPFGVYLKKTIGEARFNDLVTHFKVTRRKTKADTRISATFDDVFEPIYERIDSKAEFSEDESKKADFNACIDVDLVLSSLPDSFLDPKMKTKKAKERLQEIAYIYHLNESDLQMMLKQVFAQNKSLEFETLIHHAQQHYQRVRTASIEKKQDPYNLNYFKRVHPKTLLEEATGSKAAVVELRTIERLIKDSGLTHEVINVLIAYVLKELDNDFPSYNYFDKVIATWKRNGVKTAEDAIEIIKKRRLKQHNKQSSNTYRKGKEKPIDTNVDWFDDYLKDQEDKS